MKQGLARGWKKWKALSERVANVQARVLLTLFYFTFAAPVGAWQWFISDRLRLKRPDGETLWLVRSAPDRTLDDALKQF